MRYASPKSSIVSIKRHPNQYGKVRPKSRPGEVLADAAYDAEAIRIYLSEKRNKEQHT
jgi:hypothetical protein